jgi:hypothetical protein
LIAERGRDRPLREQVPVGSCVSRNVVCRKGETAMSDNGKKDKGKREQKKKPKLNPKEKRKLKNEKKQKGKFMPI